MEKFPEEIKQFIENIIWTFAKTMPDWPHEYIVKEKVDNALFIETVMHIRKYGYQGWFYEKPITYFKEDALIYWTMGNPVDETIIINRTKEDNSYENRLKQGTLTFIKVK